MRDELERRALVVAAVGLVIGLTIARHPFHALFLIPFFALLKQTPSRALLAGGFLVGALLSPGQPPAPLTEEMPVRGAWFVASLPKITQYGQRCEIEQGDLRLMLTVAKSETLCPGSRVMVQGVAKPPAEGTEDFYASRNLVGRVNCQSVQFVTDGPWVQRIGCAWRDSFLAFCNQSLSPSAAAATSSLCFNADGLISDDMRDEMQRTGTTHIIAASGLQVIVLAMGLMALTSFTPLPRGVQIGLVACVLVFYAVATGLHAPVVRAAMMWLIANSAYLVRREPDWPSALAATSILFLVFKPETVYEMGFQFSVIAVVFLALFADRPRWRPGIEAWLARKSRQMVRSTAIAFVVTAPLIAYYFGVLSLVSIPANLLVVVAVTPVVVMSMAAFFVGLASAPGGAFLMKLTMPLTSYIDAVLHSFGGEKAALNVPPFSGYWLVLFYVLLLLTWKPHVRQP